jgi:sucrose-6-phosphate hydrolase SacC (GH32 family)
MLSGQKGEMPIPLNDGRLHLRILVDRSTVDIFGDRGSAYGCLFAVIPAASFRWNCHNVG